MVIIINLIIYIIYIMTIMHIIRICRDLITHINTYILIKTKHNDYFFIII
jgi:hypothetical protein